MYILLTYSPIIPNESSCIPPRRNIGITVDAQPGTVLSVNNRVAIAQMPTIIDRNANIRPVKVIMRSGTVLNDVNTEEFENSIVRVGCASLEEGVGITPTSHTINYFRSCIMAPDHCLDGIDIILKI